MNGLARRRRALRLGKAGENLAALWLRCKAYRILARNVRLGGIEIDLIVRRGRRLAAIEVKTRQNFDSAALALGSAQRDRILQGLRLFLQRHPELGHCEIACDMVLVVPGRLPRHLRDAWHEKS